MGKVANIIGSTGLVGKQIVHLLLDDDRYDTVRVFQRRSLGIDSNRLDEHIVDFDSINDWKHLVQGDELYSALGTTIKTAGSKERQYEIDYHYQYQVAEAASENGIGTYLLVSSAGASSKSPNFYLGMKGALDEAVNQLSFQRTYIFQPSLLAGEREKNRLGEKISYAILQPLSGIPFIKKYRPIMGYEVALAMINVANNCDTSKQTFVLDELFDWIHRR